MILVSLVLLPLLVVGPLSFSGICMAAESCAPIQLKFDRLGSSGSRTCGLSAHGGPPFINTSHNNIRMDTMDVTIRLKNFTYVVDAEYRFYNTGATRREEVVFVKCGLPHTRCMVYDFIRFELRLNGEKIDCREEKNLPGESPGAWAFCPPWRLIVGDVTFPGNTPTTVRARYEAYYKHSGLEGRIADYASDEQAAWKGLVGKTSFIIDSNLVGETRRELPKLPFCAIDRAALLDVIRFWEIGLTKCPSFESFNISYLLHYRRPCSRCKANRGDFR